MTQYFCPLLQDNTSEDQLILICGHAVSSKAWYQWKPRTCPLCREHTPDEQQRQEEQQQQEERQLQTELEDTYYDRFVASRDEEYHGGTGADNDNDDDNDDTDMMDDEYEYDDDYYYGEDEDVDEYNDDEDDGVEVIKGGIETGDGDYEGESSLYFARLVMGRCEMMRQPFSHRSQILLGV